MDQAKLTEVDERVHNLETDVNHRDLDTVRAVETTVQGAQEDGLKHDSEVLGVPHHEKQLGVGEAGESSELPGQHGAAGAGLPDCHPDPVPLVAGHPRVGAGLEARQMPLVLQICPRDEYIVTGHFNYLTTCGKKISVNNQLS